LEDQKPFNTVRDDLTWREIPSDADSAAFRVAHYSKNARKVEDFNTVLPLGPLKELAAERFIGSVASVAFTFMGRIFKRTQLQKAMAPAIVDRLQALTVDAALLVPV
jgi:hypothetical protein